MKIIEEDYTSFAVYIIVKITVPHPGEQLFFVSIIKIARNSAK